MTRYTRWGGLLWKRQSGRQEVRRGISAQELTDLR